MAVRTGFLSLIMYNHFQAMGSMDVRPTVSVIIPTWNGEQRLDKLLFMLEHQTLVPDEIIVVDSGSTDATCTIAHCHHVRLVEIAKADFDHGGTRTMAAGLATGEILVYMTQDAIPADKDALERLILPFSADEKIAASYGRQLANEDAGFFSEHLRLFNYPAGSDVHCWENRSQYGFKTIFISNSFAAYRHDVLAAYGYFPKRLLFGEDTLTVAKLVENGYRVAYVGDALVYHSHNYSILQDAKRYFDIGVFHFDHDYQLRKFGGVGGAGMKYICSELALMVARKKYHLLPEWIMRNFGKYIAYHVGKHYKMLPRCCAKFLSMHPGWWS